MKSYKPNELFHKTGRFIAKLTELAPKGEQRMGANPHANGGILLRDLRMPDFRDYAVKVPKPGVIREEATRVQGAVHTRRALTQRRCPELPRLQPGRNHNPIEEDPGGMYEQCEELAGAEIDRILRQLQNYSEVKVLPHVDSPFVMEATRRALARAGYHLEV